MLQWALQIGIVPLVGPSQHAHMADGVTIARRVTATTRPAACRQVAHNDQGTCAQLLEEGGLLEDGQLREIQSIGGAPPSTNSGRQRQRQTPMLLAEDEAPPARAGHRPQLLLISNDREA